MLLGMARGEQATKKPPAISAVNMIVGAEEFLAERQRFAIVNAARKSASNPELPVEQHKATNLSEPQLIELLSPSLFAERSEEHTSELQSHFDLVCRLLLEKKKKI